MSLLLFHHVQTPTHPSRPKSNASSVKYFLNPSILTLYLANISVFAIISLCLSPSLDCELPTDKS